MVLTRVVKKILKHIYFFLPVQLFFLHFRKYQLILIFWFVLAMTVNGNIAPHFGAQSLFLAPEYMGKINFFSMFLLGGAMCVFAMSWNITTFIVHSRRIPYLGATRHAFVVYCLNNAIIPVAFFVFSSVYTVHYQLKDEHAEWTSVFLMQAGYYLGFVVILLLSFSYFFAASSDAVKFILAKITNPSRIRDIIPYDGLDEERDMLTAHSYISDRVRIENCEHTTPINQRMLNAILKHQHRNVIFATFASYIILLILGIFIEEPMLKIPAGVGFLLLFSIFMGFVGAFRYFLKSWVTLGWVLFAVVLSLCVKYNMIDLRSIAFGMSYDAPVAQQPEYNYESMKRVFTKERYESDKQTEEHRLNNWLNRRRATDSTKPPLIVITASGGGLRSAYWTFRLLQYADSMSHGRLFRHTVMITGASGGMMGAAYWRSVHDASLLGNVKNRYDPVYQKNIGKDLLNSIILSLATNDLISPFNKIKLGGLSYMRDRGYAMEQEMIANTEGLLDRNIGYFKDREAAGIIPQAIINGTIINDGRKLLISAQPVAYLSQPEYSLDYNLPIIDGIDFCRFFEHQHPEQLRLSSALRMNATFPIVLPVVRLPSQPQMNIMDAGLRDNFGMEVASRYLFAMRHWMEQNAGNVIFLEIRDTRENTVCRIENETTLADMLTEPAFVIQEKWEAFQSFNHTFFKDVMPCFMTGKLKLITLQYIPPPNTHIAELNFHLTEREKIDINKAITEPGVQARIKELMEAIR